MDIKPEINNMNGVIKINNTDCQFSFDGEILDIYANNWNYKIYLLNICLAGSLFFWQKESHCILKD